MTLGVVWLLCAERFWLVHNAKFPLRSSTVDAATSLAFDPHLATIAGLARRSERRRAHQKVQRRRPEKKQSLLTDRSHFGAAKRDLVVGRPGHTLLRNSQGIQGYEEWISKLCRSC